MAHILLRKDDARVGAGVWGVAMSSEGVMGCTMYLPFGSVARGKELFSSVAVRLLVG